LAGEQGPQQRVARPGHPGAGGGDAVEVGARAQDDHVVGVGADQGGRGRVGQEVDGRLVDDQGGRRVAAGGVGQAVAVEGQAGGHLGVGDDNQLGGVEGGVDLVDRRELLAGVPGEAPPGEGVEHRAPRRAGYGDGAVGHEVTEVAEERGRPGAGHQLAGVDAQEAGVGRREPLAAVAGRRGDVVGRHGPERVDDRRRRAVPVDAGGQVEADAARPAPPVLGQVGCVMGHGEPPLIFAVSVSSLSSLAARR
jgi:hypothetical protein